jgi:hypothetical protein
MVSPLTFRYNCRMQKVLDFISSQRVAITAIGLPLFPTLLCGASAYIPGMEVVQIFAVILYLLAVPAALILMRKI